MLLKKCKNNEREKSVRHITDDSENSFDYSDESDEEKNGMS